MTDEIVKQLVLRLKVENQDEFSKIAAGLAKTSEGAAKALPTKEVTDLVRLSEKLGGEFKKVVDSLTNVRLTNLKGEIKSVDDQLKNLQNQLKSTTQEIVNLQKTGDVVGASAMTRRQADIMGQMSNLGGTRDALMGMQGAIKGPGLLTRARPAMMATAMFAGQAYQMAGQYQELQGQIGQRQIESRLTAMEQLFRPIQRQQQTIYGGDVTTQIMDRMYENQARSAARAQVEKEREQLQGRVRSATGGIFTGALQQGAVGAAGGAAIGALGLGITAVPGAVIGGIAGAIRGGFQGYMERERSMNELQIFERNRRAREEDLRVRNLDTMGKTDPNRIYYQALENRAASMTRFRRSFGGDTQQVLQMAGGVQAGGEFSEQEAFQMAGQRAGRLGGFRAMSLANQVAGLRQQGFQGDVGTQMNLMQAISRQGGAANPFSAGGIFRQTQRLSNQQLQEGLMQNLGSDLGNSRVRMDVSSTAARQAFVMGQATPGADVQMRLDAFQKVMQAPDVMRTTGTIENQLVRAGMRDLVLRSGKRGGEAVALENMLSGLTVDELRSPEVRARLKRMGIDPKEVGQRRRNAEISSFEAAGVPQEILQKLRANKPLSASERERLALVQTGGALAGQEELGVMGRRLESEVNRRGVGVTQPLGKTGPAAQYDEIFERIAETKGQQRTQLINDALNKYGGDQGFRDKLQGFLKAPPGAPGGEGGTGDLGPAIENVKTSLSAFVDAVNGATRGLGGIPPGQATVSPGAANSESD